MSGPYRIPHVRMDVAMVVTNKTPSGTYRGPGRFEADFCRERLFDLVAADLGIDRVEFRRRNLIAEADMPYAARDGAGARHHRPSATAATIRSRSTVASPNSDGQSAQSCKAS